MGRPDFIYAPALADEFRCKVPLKNTRQLFVVNGSVQGGGAPLSIRIEDGQIMDSMLQVIGVRNGKENLDLSFSETFDFGKRSGGKIVLCSHTFTMDSFKTDENVRISLDKDAVVEFVIMQNEHNRAVHNTKFDIHLAEGSVLNMVFLSLHGGVIRNDIKVSMEGEHAECNLSGLYLTDSEQLMDYSTEVVHLVPSCRSSQLFKGVLDDKGKAHFDGIIKVVPDAQKSEAYQANHNLLLSDDAKAFTEPQLEIYADDVKCSHGATVGRLDEDELFYMRTRGIPASEAGLLQQMAFTFEVLEKISVPELRERLQSLVEKRLRGEFAHCRNCSKNCC
ncbi:MAG: Fe-S cluster assembly protein SufD [Bacteroidales bacterium]|nr:Fe-S cluster assembly protein SufD [Candidatus Cacconaster merdequi]